MSDDLRKLAEAADRDEWRGPWTFTGLDPNAKPVIRDGYGLTLIVVHEGLPKEGDKLAAYIAAASPEVVLRLLDERDARRETAQNGGCKCDPPGSGEEWCVGTCIERIRADAAEARERTLRAAIATARQMMDDALTSTPGMAHHLRVSADRHLARALAAAPAPEDV